MKLIIAGGGTGGHLFPGIAVAEEFLSRSSANEVLFVGTERGIEARAVPAAGYRLELISAAGIRGKGTLSQITGAAKMVYGYAQSRKVLKSFWRLAACRFRVSSTSRTPFRGGRIDYWPDSPARSSSRWKSRPATSLRQQPC